MEIIFNLNISKCRKYAFEVLCVGGWVAKHPTIFGDIFIQFHSEIQDMNENDQSLLYSISSLPHCS